MKNKKRLIKLISSNSKHFYIKKKSKTNKKNLELKKFDPIKKKHYLYREQKI